jgi:hypothetical protein
MKTVHNSFDKLNSKVGAKFSTSLPIDRENVEHTHCGTGIKFTLETVTEAQIETMIAKGSTTFIKCDKPKPSASITTTEKPTPPKHKHDADKESNKDKGFDHSPATEVE